MKSPETNPSSVTLNVRKFRERQRERGLIKRELWVRPEYTEALSLLEKGMREPGFRPESAGVPLSTPASEPWSLASLEQALLASPLVVEGKVGVEHLEGAEPSLRLTLHEHGGLAVLLALSGDQILVEAYHVTRVSGLLLDDTEQQFAPRIAVVRRGHDGRYDDGCLRRDNRG